MLDIIKHYLKNENYFITLYKDCVYLYKYLEIIKFTNNLISVKFDKFIVNIIGENLSIKRMEKIELLIKGNIMKVEKIYV